MNVKFQAAYLAGFCVGAFAAFQAGAEGLPVTENLKFHADASVGVTTNGSGQVTRWADQSESDLDLTSSNSRPTYHETAYGPAVSFNGWNYIQSTQNAINYATHTVIVVAKPSKSYSTDTNRPGDMFASNISGGTSYAQNKDILLLCNWDNGNMLRASVYGSGANRSAYSTRGNSTDLVVFEQRFDGTTLTARVDGTDVGSLAVTDFNPTASAGVNLGGRPGLAGKLFYGDIYEVLVYDRAITDDERTQLNRYLGFKWRMSGYSDDDPLEVTDGLRFRMDANAAGNVKTNASGHVTSYSDCVREGMLAIQQTADSYRPLYREVDGVKSFYFDGNDYLASVTHPIDYSQHNIFIVVKPFDKTTTQGDLFLGDTEGVYMHGGVMMMCHWDAGNVLRGGIWHNANYTAKSTMGWTDQPVILEQRFDGSSLQVYANGSYGASATVAAGFSQKGGVNLGGRSSYAISSQLFKGDMYEALVFDRALTQIERYRILKHLYEKWGVQDAFKATIDAYIAECDGRTAMQAKCPVADGLQFWCAADEAWSLVTNANGQVTQWKDGSANARSVGSYAGCTAPSFVEKGYFLDRPCVRLSGNGAAKCGLFGANGQICYSNHTIFVVAQPAALACGEDMFGSYVESSGVKAGGVLMCANKNSNSLRAMYAATDSSYQHSGDSGLGAARTTHTLYEQRMTDDKLFAAIWSLGEGRVSKSVNLTIGKSVAKTGVSLGGRFTNAYGWNGSFAEVMVYDRALTDDEVTAVETYLRGKWFSNDFTVTVQDDGTPTSIAIADTTALSAGKVTLAGDAAKLEAGRYEIVTAAGISVGQNWTLDVEQPSERRLLKLKVEDGKLVLNVSKFGMMLIFR